MQMQSLSKGRNANSPGTPRCRRGALWLGVAIEGYVTGQFRAQSGLSSCQQKSAEMSAQYEAFYASTPMRALFARELGLLAPILAGIYGNFGLHLSAYSQDRTVLPAHKFGAIIELCSTRQGRLQGDVVCEESELPFASASFNMVIAQHAFEHSVKLEESVAELARVLLPEGMALIFGFNPLGTWRPWLEWRGRSAGVGLSLQSAQAWRQLLLREQIDTLQVSFPGTLLPRGTLIAREHPSRISPVARFGSSWLLLARKRRSTLTPLRERARNRELGLRPRLVPGAQRARA